MTPYEEVVELAPRLAPKERLQLIERVAASVQREIDIIDFDEVDDRSIDEIQEGIKESLRQAIRGQTVPLDSLWTDDDMSDMDCICC